uniref:KOW domain-containing protein n=1 Tax=Oryza meridionalis TaxID=40149 RepID=A0A0E0DTM4_9ORYZ
MAVKGKGKAVAAASASGGGVKRRKGPGDAAGPSSSSSAAAESAKRRRRSGVLQFFDDAAFVGDDDDDEDEDEEEEEEEEMFASDGDDDGFFTEGKAENVNLKRTERSHPLPFLGIVKEEELSGDELEEFIKDRYSSRVKHHTPFDGSTNVQDDEFTEDGLLKEPVIWRIKCMVGRERQIAFCLMQKYVDLQKFGTKVPIISAFALDHVRGFVFVEAEKACDVTEACKGFCSVYVSRINSVPVAEVPSLLSSRAKPFAISPGTWVRMKTGIYKGDLAQVVSADEGRKRVMIKLIPRVDLRAISKKIGGAIPLKEAAIPAPRLISSQELEFFGSHIERKHDRQTNDFYEVLDGLMFKDGFLYKRVALSSLIYWGIQPTETELLKFSSTPTNTSSTDDLDWVSSMYGPKKRNIPKEPDMEPSSSKASSSKGKYSKASSKASTSTEDYEDKGFNLHDLVLFGRRDFGVVIAFEKDGLRILKGGPEGSAVTVRKQDIKDVCADKMLTAVDHKKKIICINDTVNVLEGPFQGKQGVVKHLYMGILFIHNESESENSGFFCAQCSSCENVKKRKELANERPYRSTREQLFSIGEMLRIRKGPMKGYLCRVVRIFRNDVTVKLDSLLKIVTVQAEFLSVPAKRGDNSSGAPSGPFGSEADKPSWDNGLPSFGSDSWQPFSSAALPVQNADGESEVDPWCKKTASSANDSDPWGTETKSASFDVWNNGTTQEENSSDNAWDRQPGGSGSNIGGSSWDRTATDKESGKSDNWGEACKETEKTGSDADPWGSKVKEIDLKETDIWGKASMQPEKKLEDDSQGWGQPVGKSNQDQEKGADKCGAWDTVIAGSSSSVPGRGDDDSWVKTDTLPVGQDDAWGKSKDSSDGAAAGWNETRTSNQSHSTGGWDAAAANLNESSDVDARKDAWGKAKDTTANAEEKNNESGNWNKAGPLDKVCGSDWGSPKFSSGDGPSSWNKGDKVGGDSQNGSWSRPGGNFEGGRGFGRGRGRGRARESGDLGGRNDQGSWKNSGTSDSYGRPSWRSDSQVDKEVGDSGGYWGRGRGRGQYGGQGRGDNGWRNGGQSNSEFGRSDADAPNWGNKGVSNKGSWDSGDNWNAPKSSDENQTSAWNSSEDKRPSGGQEQQSGAWASKMTSIAGAEDKSDAWGTKAEGNSGSTGGKWENASFGEEQQSDPWGSKICSNKGKEQETDPWTSKVTSAADAGDNNNVWNTSASDTASGSESKWGNAGAEEKADAWKSKVGSENSGGWNQKSSWGKPSFSGGEQEPAWSNPKNGDDNSGYGRGGFGRGNRGRGRGRNFGDSGSSWSGGSYRNDESHGERSEDRWNTRDSDGVRGRGRGRFGRGDRNQGNNYGSGDNNDRTWGSGRGNRDQDGCKNWNRNDDRRPFGQDRGGGWSQSSDWNANKGQSSWGSDKNDSWGAPKPSGGDDQAGKNNGNNPWGAPADSMTGDGPGGGESWKNKTEDTWNSSGGTRDSGTTPGKSSWGGSEDGQKKEGSWGKSEGSGRQVGGGSSWDKPDGGWNSNKGEGTQGGGGGSSWDKADGGNSNKGQDAQGGGGGSSWDKADGGWNSSSKGGSSGNGGW